MLEYNAEYKQGRVRNYRNYKWRGTMGLLSRIKGFFAKANTGDDYDGCYDGSYEDGGLQEGRVIRRDDIDMHDSVQREEYVTACLEQMAEASRELDTLNNEYNLVTSYLTDIEEVEAFDEELKEQVRAYATKIVDIENSREKVFERKKIMSDEDYFRMEKVSRYMPEAYNRIKEAEEFQTVVKRDMGRLDGERHAYYFRKNELETGMQSMKYAAAITVGFMAVLIMVLAIVGLSWKIDVGIGYCIAVLVAAITLTVVYVRYHEASRELTRVEKSINKLVLLHNTVKIKYVNNTNLLEYLYVKYDVNSSGELKSLWNKYNEENRQRQQQLQLQQDMDINQAALVKLLRRSNVQDPSIWINQARALIDRKEMVEIRHSLIIRRQKLRKQMEYNAKMAQEAQDEVKNIVNMYPEYARKILDMVSDYEKALA